MIWRRRAGRGGSDGDGWRLAVEERSADPAPGSPSPSREREILEHLPDGIALVDSNCVVHLLTNASVLGGPGAFQSRVNLIHSLGPLLVPVEWAFIFLPMLFHATVGFVIIANGLPNVGSYPYAGNVRYTLQRATGMIAFAFILWHRHCATASRARG